MRSRRGCSGAWLAVLAAAADRLTKVLAQAHWAARSPLLSRDFDALIPGLLNLRMRRNTGVAFSQLSDRGALPGVLAAVLIAALLGVLFARVDMPRLRRAGLWLIVGGGLGNLFDRLRYGYVIDFLDLAFVRFAVFNVADVCVCAGAALVVAQMLLSDGKRRRGDGA